MNSKSLDARCLAHSHGTSAVLAIAAVVTCSMLAATPAHAGDYYHACRSVDGQYVMNDENLQTIDDQRSGRSRSIRYRVRNKIVLKKEEGYCFARSQSGGQRARFSYGFSRYVLDISFHDNGQKVDTSLLCELAADGLPAAYNCGRRVVTIDWTLKSEQPPSSPHANEDRSRSPQLSDGNLWSHNGSVMRLTANGNNRQIVYERPRSGLAERGVEPGEVLFDGQRNGNSYSGIAYIFTKSCGKAAYSVSGSVQENDTRVVMTGFAPRFNSACRQIGKRKDRLVFTLQR